MGLNWSAIGVGATVIIAAFTAQQCTNEQISSLRKEVKQDVSSLRKEVREDAALLRKELREEIASLRTDIARVGGRG